MPMALAKNLVNDRLVGLFGTVEQTLRHAEGVLPEEELREAMRFKMFADLENPKTSKRLYAADYGATPDRFKVMERPRETSGLSAEQFTTWSALRERCQQVIRVPGLEVSRIASLVEKVVTVDDKQVDVVPMALVEILVLDTQGRCSPFMLRRRVEL